MDGWREGRMEDARKKVCMHLRMHVDEHTKTIVNRVAVRVVSVVAMVLLVVVTSGALTAWGPTLAQYVYTER